MRARHNSDAERRRHERDATASDTLEGQARVLVDRMRAGELEPGGWDRILLAAALGDEGARAAAPNWPATTGFATMEGRLGPDDPFVLGAVADALRGYLRPWGPEVMRQVYGLSAARVDARLQARHRDAGGWRTTYDRAIVYMTQENFSAALEAVALAILFLSNEDDHFAMDDEQARQQADMIAILLRRDPPRTTIRPNPPKARMNSDAERRRRERDAAASDAPADETRMFVDRLRDGTYSMDQEALEFLARLGYGPAQVVAGPMRVSGSRAAVLGDPGAQALETLFEVGYLHELWPLACAAALLAADECVVPVDENDTNSLLASRTALAAVEAALVWQRGLGRRDRALMPHERDPLRLDAQGMLMQLDHGVYRDVIRDGPRQASELLQAVAGLYSWLAFEQSGRRGYAPAEYRDLHQVIESAVDACRPDVSTEEALEQAQVRIARAITEAVVPVILAGGNLEASPLVARLRQEGA